MATLSALAEEGEKLGFLAVSMEKLRRIGDRAFAGREIMKRAGVKMGLGTDLLGASTCASLPSSRCARRFCHLSIFCAPPAL